MVITARQLGIAYNWFNQTPSQGQQVMHTAFSFVCQVARLLRVPVCTNREIVFRVPPSAR